eukprot:scaffold11994_cov85-Phaeocystis_antarctica.AAC.1
MMHFTGGEIIPRRVLCPWRAHLLASTLPAVARATAACFVRCAYARLTQPVHRPWSPFGRRWGSEVPVSRPRAWRSAALDCRQLRQAGRRVLTRSFDTRSKVSIDLVAVAIKPGSSEAQLTTSGRARSESGSGSFFALNDLTG